MKDDDRYGNGMMNEHTKAILEYPSTELSRLIGQKWFNTLEKLSKQSGVGKNHLLRVVKGEEISEYHEQKLRAFLDKL